MALKQLSDLKRLRKKYDISQKKLAKDSGVSQSLITKIESGKVEPGYNKVKKLFEILENYQKTEELKAKEIMTKKVISVKVSDKINLVKNIMTKKGISQLPVYCKNKVCGLVTEATLIENFGKKNASVGDIMEDTPPIVSVNTKLQTIQNILQDYPIILVTNKGDIKGAITKTDLLKGIYQ